MNGSESNSERNTTREVIRWVAVLPVAIVGSWIAGGSIGSLVSTIGIDTRGSAFPAFVFPLIQYIPSGLAFTLGGAMTAPGRRILTALILTIAWGLLSLTVHILGQPNPGLTNTMHFLGGLVGASLGMVVIVWQHRAQAPIQG